MKRKSTRCDTPNLKRKRPEVKIEKKQSTGCKDAIVQRQDVDSFQELLSSLKPSRKILKTLISKSVPLSMLKEEIEDTESGEGSENESEVEGEMEGEERDLASSRDEDSEDEIVDHGVNFEDPFKNHFEVDLPERSVEEMQKMKNVHSEKTIVNLNNWRKQERFDVSEEVSKKIKSSVTNLTSTGRKLMLEACVRENVLKNWEPLNKSKKNELLTPLQEELFQVIGCYKDLFFFDRNLANGEEIRRLYCLHAINHILKTRSRILKSNAKISQAERDNIEIHDCRDQGLTRPKVLILVPFKDSCLQIVNNIIKLAFNAGKKGQVMQKKRFLKEFSSDPEEAESKANRPDDFKKMFKGNIDDCFRVGVSVSKNTVKLFSPFYASDIIIASPLGLRTIIGSEGEKQDFDFLSSIEVLIADQADVFLMQNWEHVLHIFDYLHLTPKKSHDTDFSRVRMWNVNGWSQYYRQTIWLSSIQTPEMSSIFNKFTHNDYNGKIKLLPREIHGSVEQIVFQTPQIYHLVSCPSFADIADKRFDFFVNTILSGFKGQLSSNTAIFIPSYFDFVRIRNYFKKEELSFTQISEYSKRSNISRARSLFHEKKKHFLLLTERFYFFYRYRIRGIKHIIFYDLPHYPQFYSEIINFLESSTQQSSAVSCTILYSQFDGYKLEAIVGSTRCKQMMSSKKDIHMVITVVYIKMSLHCEGMGVVATLQSRLSSYEDMILLFSHVGDPRNTFLVLFPLTYCLDTCLGLKVLWTSAIVEWLNALLKWIARDDRPYWWVSTSCSYTRDQFKQFPITCESGPGFPSGHVMANSSLGLLLILHTHSCIHNKKLKMLFSLISVPCLFCLVTFVCVSRVYIATHFPHQVIAGAIIGCCSAVWINSILSKHSVDVMFSIKAAFCGCSGLLIGVLLYYTLFYFNLNPLATVDLALEHCESREWVHLDTTLFFAIIRDSGCLTGLGLTCWLLRVLLGPQAKNVILEGKLPPCFGVICVFILCPLVYVVESVDISQTNIFVFYVIAFIKFSLLPCYVIASKCIFEMLCDCVLRKKCQHKCK